MHEVRYATEERTEPRGAATSSAADEAMARQKGRELLRQGAERRKAATATKHSRKTASTPLVSPTASPSSTPPTKTETPKATSTATTPKVDGDGTAPPAKDSPPVGGGTGYKGYGKPFEKGNREQMKSRCPLTTDEIREITRSAMTKVGLRRLVRRLTKIADTANPREAIAASRMLLDLIGGGEITKGNASGPGPMIVMPTPPER